MLQSLDSEESPVQFLPPCAGVGWEQDRTLSEVPPPHVFEQEDQAAQSVNPPSTGDWTPPKKTPNRKLFKIQPFLNLPFKEFSSIRNYNGINIPIFPQELYASRSEEKIIWKH